MDFKAEDFIELREEDIVNTKQVVLIRNLPHDLDERDYKKYFGQFGKMMGMTLLRTKKSGASRGILFVKYVDPDIARIVQDTLNNHILDGKLVKTTLVDGPKDAVLKTTKRKEATKPKKSYITEETLRRSKEKDEKLKAELKKYGIKFVLPNEM